MHPNSIIGLFPYSYCKVIAPNLLCFLFGIILCLFFLIALKRNVATIAAKIVGRAITKREQYREEAMKQFNKPIQKIKQRATSRETNEYIRTNREKSNFAFAILEINQFESAPKIIYAFCI